DRAVAVVVEAVADLVGARADVGVGVVAVAGVEHVARHRVAVRDPGGAVAHPVAVAVGVPARGRALVDHGVAVVVERVAQLGGAGPGVGVRVVAVGAVVHVVRRGHAERGGGGGGVAEPVGVGVGVPDRGRREVEPRVVVVHV